MIHCPPSKILSGNPRSSLKTGTQYLQTDGVIQLAIFYPQNPEKQTGVEAKGSWI